MDSFQAHRRKQKRSTVYSTRLAATDPGSAVPRLTLPYIYGIQNDAGALSAPGLTDMPTAVMGRAVLVAAQLAQ